MTLSMSASAARSCSRFSHRALIIGGGGGLEFLHRWAPAQLFEQRFLREHVGAQSIELIAELLALLGHRR